MVRGVPLVNLGASASASMSMSWVRGWTDVNGSESDRAPAGVAEGSA